MENKPSEAPDWKGLLSMRSNRPPVMSSVFSSRFSAGSIDIRGGILSLSISSTASMRAVSSDLKELKS